MTDVLLPVEALASGKARKGMAMALNHSLAKTETQVNRALVKQTGLKYGAVKAAIKRYSASAATLQGLVMGTGRHIGLEKFSARKTKSGVSAAPWGTRRIFAGTFFIKSFSGGVFKRTTDKRFPIKKLYGPSIPKELIKDQSKAAFNRTIAAELPKRVEHELARMMSGSV